ncbi:MAG: T9SS type A sorting domain-containing protein [Paludibacteraceae bacterium]|nr:T9SS type A sorting domain-containing protein [Paludibacteraceae bacterium]
MRKTILGLAVIAGAMAFGTAQADTEQLAFPGAEGFGRYATGGRGGVVYYVTSLDDCPDSDLKEGTLRWALKTGVENAPRTILFKVGGTIHLTSQLKFSGDNVSILGQSAPGGGICIADKKFMLNGAQNVIVRYLRFRCGDNYNESSFGCENSKNIIIDHCSFSWSAEENITMYDGDNLTMQWCISSEPLYNSINKKGTRAYGAQWGGELSSYHHNVFAHCAARVPQIYGVSNSSSDPDSHDFHVDQEMYNNVVYNAFGSEAAYNGRVQAPNVADAYVKVNMANNYYKPGPTTKAKNGNRVFLTIYNEDSETAISKWYVAGNKYELNDYATSSSATLSALTAANNDNWTDAKNSAKTGINFKSALTTNISIGGTGTVADYVMASPSVNSGIVITSADEAYADVVSKAGANWPSLDEVDARVLAEAAGLQEPKYVGPTATAFVGVIDSPSDLKPADADDTWSAYPDLTAFPDEVVPADTDGDGMPDIWEDANEFNKNDASDGVAVAANGYTNLENYLNSIVEGVKAPSNITAKRNSAEEAVITWDDNSDTETGFRLDRADITAGTDTVFVNVAETAADVTEFTDATASSDSKYIYRVSALTSTGATNAVRTVLYVKSGDESGLSERQAVDGLTVAPNPVKNVINIASGEALKTVEVVDMDGRAVLSVNAKGKSALSVNASALTNGLYITKVTAESGNVSAVKIIKE